MLVLRAIWLVLFVSRFVLSETRGYIKIYSPQRFSSSKDASDSVIGWRQLCLGKEDTDSWNTLGCTELQNVDGTFQSELSLPIQGRREFTHILIRDGATVRDDTKESSNSDYLRKENVDFAEIPLMFPNDGVRHLTRTEKGLEFEMSLLCEEHYYGPKCHTHCDSSELGKRFKCNPQTGEVVCSFGWIGLDCSENVFIDKKAAFEFLNRPKRSEDREDCSKRRCTKEELRNKFLLYGSELSDDDWASYLGGEGSSDCAEDHCDRNGTLLCLRLDGEKYACRCKAGYKGDRCEESDLCYFEPCHNGGVCEDGEEGVFCKCPSGFRGTFCDEKVQSCRENPCNNNGKCESDVDGFRCDCIEGFSGQTCEVNINDCPENSCNGRGRCNDGANAYECACDDGYYGKDCEIIDPCSREPCENGGVCRSYSDGFFQCNCPEEFEGQTCSEKREDPCDGNPCNGHGVCTSVFEKQDGDTFPRKRIAKCFCNIGYTGEHCETEVSPCDLAPCPENATCIDYENEFICSCPNGYEGEYCERKCDVCERSDGIKCKSNPCENNARCMVVEGETTCICPAGFTGRYCESEINFCHEDLCGHGECLSTTSGYECLCEYGYTGEHCDEDINECEEQHYLCKNEGECRNTIGSYTCLCPKGYKGEHCDHKIDACSAYPCKNGGTCHPDGIYSFQCFCKIGFVGMTCESRLDYCEDKPCKNGGTCKVMSLENQLIKCTCTERFYGESCEEEIPICSAKRERPDGTFELTERTDCGSNGKCVPAARREFICECSNGYEGSFCEKKIQPFQCNEPYCVCDGDVGDGCDHRTYGGGKCAKEDCLAENCSETENLVCRYEAKCPNRKISARINRSNITQQPCDILVIFFDRQGLPMEATTGTICREMRNSSAMLENMNDPVLICSLQEKTEDDIKITVTLRPSRKQSERTLNDRGAKLLQVLQMIINSNGTKDNNGSSLSAIQNVTFDNKTIFPQSQQPSSVSDSGEESTLSPVDRTASSNDIYMIIPVTVVGSILVIVLLIALVIWAKKLKRAQAPTSTGPDNNNLSQDIVTWSKTSNGKSSDNSVSFGAENGCFTAEESSFSKMQSISPCESDPRAGVTTFVPRNGGLHSESSSSITKR